MNAAGSSEKLDEGSVSRKRNAFVRLANKRVNRALDHLRLVGNLANRANYEYTAADVKKIIGALQREMDQIRSKFSDTESSDSHFRL